MPWWDFFKLWTYARRDDPFSERLRTRQLTGAGVTQPDAIPDIRQGGEFWGGSRGVIRLRESNDFVDLSSVQNRINRYKEYERLRAMAEIETVMQIFADESCVAGHTRIATVEIGYRTISWLAKHRAGQRFTVYCWDFDKQDYTIGWAYDPRQVKVDKTVRVKFDNGKSIVCTEDHGFLTSDGEWVKAGNLHFGTELIPFYRLRADQYLTEQKTRQFPRIFTFKKGWTHERMFIDEWRNGEPGEHDRKVQETINLIGKGVKTLDIAKIVGHRWATLERWLRKEGFSWKEAYILGKKKDHRRVIGVEPWKEQPVYDLSVEKYENFCTDSCVLHNCQKNDDGHVIDIECSNKKVVQELEFLFFHRDMLNIDRRLWSWAKNLYIFGDHFLELILNPDNPKDGILKVLPLPPESVYRIETTKGKVVEFQQSKEGPDFQALTRSPITQATESELMQSTAIRFHPDQLIHMKIGEDRRTFYPYGVSLIEAARGPAHQLRLMEDAMVVYRLCVVGNTRVRTNNGYKYIKDIEVGDKVFSYNDVGELFETEIIWTVNNGVKDVFKVKSQHNEIIGTATHPILVNRDGIIQYVDIQDLIPKKDQLINATRNEEIGVPVPRIIKDKWAKLSPEQRKLYKSKEYKNKSELAKNCGTKPDRVKQFLYNENKSLPYDKAVVICDKFELDSTKLIECNKHEVKPEIVDLPEFVDEDFARLFGFLIGDGSIRSKGVGAFNQLHFCSSPDENLNNKYANLLKKYFGKVRFEKDKRSKRGLGNYTVDSRFACRLFVKMGFIPGAKNKRIPDWVHTASKSIRREFVEGISDADGCERYTKAGLWFSTIESCNKKLVEDIKEVWHSIGLCSGKLKHRKRNGGHEIEPGRKMKPRESYNVTITDRELPKYENVWYVESVGQEEVYDVTVDNEYHNIVSNGIIVHQTRAPERRVFYFDVGQLPPYKAEAFIDRMKDMFRKRKVINTRGGTQGANAIEERWHSMAQDEDYWIPIRPNTNTRVETLPGAQNLGEIDDAVYFRNKLYTALQFPKNYLTQEDPGQTRITLSAQDVKFARTVERLQAPVEDGLTEIANRHLSLRGFPDEMCEDLKIKMTAPSDWRELSRAEVLTNRLNNASNLKGSQMMPDYDIYRDWLKLSEEETLEKLSRMKIQKLEDLKLQVLASNPQLLGVGMPGQGEQEMGTEAGGPNPMLGGPPGGPPGGGPGGPGGAGGIPGVSQSAEAPALPSPDAAVAQGGQPGADQMAQPGAGQHTPQGAPTSDAAPLPDPTKDDIKKYDMDIEDYEAEQDAEDVDYSEF